MTLADVAADDAAYRETRAAFEEHSVLVLRGQDVTTISATEADGLDSVRMPPRQAAE